MTADDGSQNALKELEPTAVSESKCEEIWALDQSIGHGNGEIGSNPVEKPKTGDWMDQGMQAKISSPWL